MFEAFSDNARKTMVLANLAAAQTQEGMIAPRHILLGILKNRPCTAASILSELGVDLESLRLIAMGLPHSILPNDGQRLPQTEEAKAVIVGAIEEARNLKDTTVGSEHILFGLIRVNDPVMRAIWSRVGIDVHRAKNCLAKMRTRPAPHSRAPEPVGAYPAARRVGDLLFLSGQGPRQRGSKDIPGVVLGADGKMLSYDVAAQVRAVFQNVRWVLEEHGSSFERIVDVICFLTNLEHDFAAYNKAYAESFPSGPHQPCRTTIGITALPQGGSAPIAFEAKVVATV